MVNLGIAVSLTLFAIANLVNGNYLPMFIDVLLATVNLYISVGLKDG